MVGIISKRLSNGENAWLLVSSANDFGDFTGYYYPPGGHIEQGESEEVTLMREIREELGLNASPIRRLATTESDIKGQETAWWECRLDDDDMVVSSELRDAQYFTRLQIENEIKVWPATEKFFREFVFKT